MFKLSYRFKLILFYITGWFIPSNIYLLLFITCQ